MEEIIRDYILMFISLLLDIFLLNVILAIDFLFIRVETLELLTACIRMTFVFMELLHSIFRLDIMSILLFVYRVFGNLLKTNQKHIVFEK